MSKTTHWVCSCGRVNGLGKLKCPVCGNDLPRSVCKQIYKEELTLQRENHRRRVCEKHSRFWQRNTRKFRIARTACGVFSYLLVAVFIASFYGHSYSLRMDDLEYRCEEIGAFASHRAEGIELQQREEEVEITVFKRAEQISAEEINKNLKDLAELINDRIDQISDAKEKILDYVR